MKTKNKKFTKDSTMGEIIKANQENSIILLGFGLHCCACPMSQMETLEQACQAHNLDVNFVLERLNEK